MVTMALIMCGAPDAAQVRCDALIDVARPRGWRIALAHGSFLRAIARLQSGRVREAESDAREAFTFKLGHSPAAALVWSLFPLVEALVELDDPDEADAALTVADRAGPVSNGELGRPLLLQARAHLRLAQHRPEDAHADLVEAGSEWAALGISHPGLATWRVDDSEVSAVLGDADGARRLAKEHLALAEIVGCPAPLGAGLRALARTAGPGDAVPLLRRAVDHLDGTPAVLERVRCLVDLGAALRRANHRSEAREPLRCALDLAQQGGMRRLARRARDELRACGARPRREALSGADALTAAEHRVVLLAVQGRSNPEIAQELYVTRRTVETHLTHAFQKLGVTTRAALADHVGLPG
jgi:DNA-binding CsgD family transcriptional regulator